MAPVLTPDQKRNAVIVAAYLGPQVLGKQAPTIEEIAVVVGISPERVRQIISKHRGYIEADMRGFVEDGDGR